MMETKNRAKLVLAGLTAAAVYLCYLLFQPYITPVLFASVIAIVFYPLHRNIGRVFRNPTASALVSTLVTLLLTVFPLAFLLAAISNELTGLYASLTARSAEAGGIIPYLLHGSQKLIAWANQRFSLPDLDLREVLARRVESISSSLLYFSANLVRNIFSLVANALIAIIVLFFLFRDGERFTTAMLESLPLGAERIAELRSRVTSAVSTNFYGSFVVGAVQGSLAGLIFWMLGIDSPVLWGIVTAVFSLVPFVGTAIVWVPAAIVLMFTGHLVKGLILLGLGMALIGTIDNILRPFIVHKGVRLHPILIFFSLIGGVRLFGVLGLFVGPVIVSVAAALVVMFRQDVAPQQTTSGRSAPG